MKRTYTSIQRKLLRIVLLTSSVVLFLTCAAFFAYELYSYRINTKEQLSTLGKIVASNSTAAIAFQNTEEAVEILQALKAETHIEAASLYDAKGNLVAKYPAYLTNSQLPDRPASDGYNYVRSRLEGFEPVIQRGKRVGTLFLQSNMKGIDERLQLYFIIAVGVLAVSIFVAYLLSIRLQRTISEPILALVKTAGIVSNKDYTVRAEKFDNDELGQLTDSFNHMLEQIQAQNAEITSFNHALELEVAKRTSELETANIELKRNNEFVATIIDSSVDVIAVFDKNLNYVIMNKAGEELYGVKAKDIIGKNLVKVFPQIKDAQMYKDLQQALTGEMVHNPNYKSRLSPSILENFYIPLLDKDNQVYSVLVIGHNITEVIQAHEKLTTLNDDLEKSNKELEQFAYIASHDLQEPLRKIQTFSAMAENKLGDTETVRNYLFKINSSAGRMSSLIKAVLNYSQLTNQRKGTEQVNLEDLIESIKSDHELAISEKGAVVKYNQLPVIEGNILQLNQLFYNLFSNSLKFSNANPEINIYSSIVDSEDIKAINGIIVSGQYVKLIFKDNGIGFDQQYAEKIFTVFQRLHSRDKYPGTGIGLALCKKIIDNHHGHITVDSELGVGTTFTIYLPLTQENFNTFD